MPKLDCYLRIKEAAEYLSVSPNALRKWGPSGKRAKRRNQTILAKAFTGELVETKTDLSYHEIRDYEPTSVLLERIAAETDAAASGKR